MTPPALVQRALGVGLNVIAVTDHNAAGNARAVRQAAAGSGLAVLPGIEVETREGVHLLCLFDREEDALAMEREVWDHLPEMKNDPEAFGLQHFLNAAGQVTGECERLLLTGADLGVEEAAARCENGGGLALPSHVDRRAYGLLEVLGFMPPGFRPAAVEVSGRTSPEQARARYPSLGDTPLVYGSDAHCLADVGKCPSLFRVAAATTDELRLALAGREGRAYLGPACRMA